jgi:predicted  nucleic acid-binding Zn-ribbon protein
MTLLGKIFTLCIFIASLFLMFVAMTVYATHKNWQQAYQAKNQQLQAAQAANAALETKYQNQIIELNADMQATLQQARKLESELAVINDQIATTQAENDQLKVAQRDAIGLVAATEKNNESLTTEVEGLRGSIRENQQARDEAVITTLKATSELHTTGMQLQTLTERSKQLTQQLASAISRLLENGVDPHGDVITRSEGQISATQRADGGQLIELTIGYDDGLRENQTVEVYRGDRYLGRAIILKTDPDRAVGRVLREFQQGQIQEGDRVATKLRVG